MRLDPKFYRALNAARMFVRETELAYLVRPEPLSDRMRSAANLHEFILSQQPQIAIETKERFFALALNSKHRVTRVCEVATGTLASVDVHPREVFRELIVSSAAAFFAIHNHPSGDPEPSTDDLALTARLREAGQLVGIPMLDHMILGAEGYVSLADRGLL